MGRQDRARSGGCLVAAAQRRGAAYLGVFAADRSSWPCLPVRLGVAGRTDDNTPSADRIVCHGRAGERVAPPPASVSDRRQPTEREVEAAAIGGSATRQGGVWIRIASSRSNRRTWPAHCLLCQFGLARLVSAGRYADAARSGCLGQGPLVPTSTGPSAVTENARGAGSLQIAPPRPATRPRHSPAERGAVRGNAAGNKVTAAAAAVVPFPVISTSNTRPVRSYA
jgi:hypothetical protein